MSVYPNPSDGRVTVSVGTAGQLRVYNQLGQLVHEQALSAGPTELRLPAGLLQLLFTGAARQVGLRIVVR